MNPNRPDTYESQHLELERQRNEILEEIRDALTSDDTVSRDEFEAFKEHVDTALHKASSDLTDISVDLNQTIDDTLATDEEGRLLQYLSENANDSQDKETQQ